MGAGLLNMLIGSSGLDLVIACAGALIFSLFIVFDTQVSDEVYCDDLFAVPTHFFICIMITNLRSFI